MITLQPNARLLATTDFLATQFGPLGPRCRVSAGDCLRVLGSVEIAGRTVARVEVEGDGNTVILIEPERLERYAKLMVSAVLAGLEGR